jgi:TPR repeat protein
MRMPSGDYLKTVFFCLIAGLLPPDGRCQGEREPAATLIKRAETGDAVARVKLGLIRASTDAQLASETQAAQWYQQATEQNNIASQYSLGLMFESGPTKDSAESFRWFKMAAERGHPGGQLKV